MLNSCLALILSISTLGCVSSMSSVDWKHKIVGYKGFLRVPPNIVEHEEYAKSARFRRCEKIEVTNVFWKEFTSESYIEIKQHKRIFLIAGVGDKPFWKEKNETRNDYNPDKYVIDRFTHAVSEKLQIQSRKIVLNVGEASSKKLLCSNSLWVGMTPDELQFVRGYPVIIKKLKNERVKYFYKKDLKPNSIMETYLLENDQLVSWKDR